MKFINHLLYVKIALQQIIKGIENSQLNTNTHFLSKAILTKTKAHTWWFDYKNVKVLELLNLTPGVLSLFNF